MCTKDILRKYRSMLLNHNVYLPEENEYEDDIEENLYTPEQILKQQLYSTRLYISLLISFILIICLLLIFIPQTLVVTIDNPSLLTYKQLYNQHSSTLNCPCSLINIPYESFISVEYSLHPLCSFVNEEWIMSFYFPNSSYFGPTDFRNLANAQFQLIRQLCRLAKQTILETIEIDIEQNNLISTKLLIENEVLVTVNATVDFARLNSALIFLRTLSTIRFVIKSNNLISILRTNFDIDSSLINYIAMSILDDSNQLICQCLLNGCDVKTNIGFLNWTDETQLSQQMIYRPSWYNSQNRVNGLVGSCTILDGLLMSNLTCFYEETCLNLLLIHFPHLTREMLSNASSMLSQIQNTKSLSELIEQLFITNWLTTINYTQYFQQCLPKSCSYTYINNQNILYAFTQLLSIYGGLTVALYFITPHIIKASIHKRQQIINETKISILNKIKRLFVNLNLFKTADRNSDIIHQQRWTTRVYLLVLLNCLLIALIILATRKHTNIIIIQSPSFETYQSLLNKTNDDLNCLCSQMNIDYGSFISFSPNFHQICSSIYIEQSWIDWVTTIVRRNNLYVFDWRYLAERNYNVLSILCQLSNSTVVSATEQFQKRIYVNSHLFEQNHFEQSWQMIIEDFIHSTELSFSQTIKILSYFLQVDQPAVERGVNGLMSSESEQPYFIFLGPSTPMLSYYCLCPLDAQCQVPANIWTIVTDFPIPELIHNVSGSILACFTTESLLRSHLDCFYSDNLECFSSLINAMSFDNTIPANFNIQPLNSSLPTRFSQTDLISTIVYKLMIEQWSPTISYENYFQQCLPSQCTFSKVEHTNFIEILTTIISLYGGFSIALRLILPTIMKIFFKKSSQSESEISYFARIRNIIINLNIFPLRSFGNIANREQAKRLGRWSTRLYIILFCSSMIIFSLYTLIRPQIIRETIKNPSIDDYQQLQMHSSSSEIDCTCSSISISYEHFLHIEPSFHQICSSDFVSYEWEQNFLSRIPINSYLINDYRRFISAHLQFLGYLCQLSIEQVNNAIVSFSNSYFVNNRLLSEIVFESKVDENIRATQTNTLASLIRQLMLVREMMYGNKIVSLYQTNYRYIFFSQISDITLGQPMIYDDGCSCEFHRNCTSSTIFKGLKIGCTPSEALFSSTLECFYDEQCLQLLKNQTLNSYNKNVIMKPLNSSLLTRYSWNTTTVDDLIQELFIETWSTSINYSSYFQQCSPSQCTHTYIRRADIFNSIISLIGLSGSLTIILKWWCPILIQLFFNIFNKQIHNTIASEN